MAEAEVVSTPPPANAKTVTPKGSPKKRDTKHTKKRPNRVPVDKPATQTALVKRGDVSAELSMIERIAKDPNIGIEKLNAMIDANERIKKINAETAFNLSFAEMQQELPVVAKRGLIKVEGQVRSKYAKFEDIVDKIRPVLSKHGFSIRHFTAQNDGVIKVTGVLAHREGHSVQDEFLTRPDNGGKMNDIQRIGSAISYGKRYTLMSLCGIATAGEDDDGHATGRRERQQETAPHPQPDGTGGAVITEDQAKRLWTIFRKSGRQETEFKMWLTVVYRIDSTKKILRKDYDVIVKAIQARGPLPQPEDREPGSDG